MKRQLAAVFFTLLCVFSTCGPASADSKLVTMLTNEGDLIDDLVAQGHGDKSLFEVFKYLQQFSNGIITDAFLNGIPSGTEANPSSGSANPAYLQDFTGLNNPVGMCDDGVVLFTGTPGEWASQLVGYTTYSRPVDKLGTLLFTYATDPQYYINSGLQVRENNTEWYYVNTVVWSRNDPQTAPVPEPSTILLFGTALAGLAAVGRGRKKEA